MVAVTHWIYLNGSHQENNIIYDAYEVLKKKKRAIDSFFEKAPVGAKPLWFLGKSIELLSDADVVYFASGWENARGCRIEHECAVEYGVDIIET